MMSQEKPEPVKIPTEPIGSIPRPAELIESITNQDNAAVLDKLYEKAVRDTL
jgi:5-methyltetrahydropteroyltriglutamate--homocysteine methyltransferase